MCVCACVRACVRACVCVMFQLCDTVSIYPISDADEVVNPSLQCTTASLPLTEELLFVRKAQAIVDFCLECRNLLKAFKLDISPPEGIH